ncbi:ABC transporter permease [Jatrophihabitans fulvus]
MTTLTAPEPRTLAGAVTFGRIVRSEWTKFRSLRSTWWALGVGLLVSAGVGLLAAADGGGSGRRTPTEIAETSQFGVLLAQLAVLVLAALFVTGEYGTGMIRSTMTAVPRRVPAVLAKIVVLVGVLLPTTLLTSLATFTLTDAVVDATGKGSASLTDDGVAVIVLGGPLYLVVAAVFAVAAGTVVRNTAAAVSALAGLFFVVPAVAGLVAGVRDIAPVLPSNAGGALSHQTLARHPLSGGIGFALFCAYTAALLLVALVRLRRTDV